MFLFIYKVSYFIERLKLLSSKLIHSVTVLDAANVVKLEINKETSGLQRVNTAVKDVFTKNNFSIAMFDLFRLEAEKIEYIWHLFEESKSSLITAALLNAVTSIRRANNNLDFLYELLSSLGEE